MQRAIVKFLVSIVGIVFLSACGDSNRSGAASLVKHRVMVYLVLPISVLEIVQEQNQDFKDSIFFMKSVVNFLKEV